MSESNKQSFSKKNQSAPRGLAEAIAAEFAKESKQLLDQSVMKIENCLAQLNDHQVWWRPSNPSEVGYSSGSNARLNSVANLILHIGGNLQQWAIAGVGGKPDLRDRAAEFSSNDVIPKDQLLQSLKAVVDEAKQVIESIDERRWTDALVIQGFQVSVLQAIQHTCTHFVGHTHQIIMLARLQLGDRYLFHWTPDTERKNLPI